jgi:hypothetical protein
VPRFEFSPDGRERFRQGGRVHQFVSEPAAIAGHNFRAGDALLAFGALRHNHGATLGVIVMATASSPEESAKVILTIFKVMGFRSGAILQRDQVQMQFTVNGGTAADFTTGLQYGADNGWFELPSTITIKLTDAGFAKCKTAENSN